MMKRLIFLIALIFSVSSLYGQTTSVENTGGANLNPASTVDEECRTREKIFNWCLTADLFDPTTRVYIDNGNDDPGEIDIFTDGSLTPTMEVFGVTLPWRLGRKPYHDKWSWGPFASVGIGASAQDSEDGATPASDAPVVLLSYGFTLQYEVGENLDIGLEVGRATGFSSGEGLSDIDDTATFVGIRFKGTTSKE